MPNKKTKITNNNPGKNLFLYTGILKNRNENTSHDKNAIIREINTKMPGSGIYLKIQIPKIKGRRTFNKGNLFRKVKCIIQTIVKNKFTTVWKENQLQKNREKGKAILHKDQ
jgi:hypothetical protein